MSFYLDPDKENFERFFDGDNEDEKMSRLLTPIGWRVTALMSLLYGRPKITPMMSGGPFIG